MKNGEKFLEHCLLDKKIILKNVCELYGRTLYSYKTHAKQADIYKNRIETLKNIELALISLSACGIISVIATDHKILQYITAILNFLSLCLSIHMSSKPYEELIRQHLKTTHILWGKKEVLINAINDYKNSVIEVKDLIRIRDQVIVGLEDIYSNAPQTTSTAYQMAQKALKHSEEHYFSEGELEAL